MPYIVIDPDGGNGFGLGVVVRASTGVTYEHQCDGHACDQREVEGFFIPLGSREMAQPLIDWFAHPRLLTENTLQELAELLSRIPIFYTRDLYDASREFLLLDQARLEEVAEAWVPVITPYGAGVLVFENKD